MSKRNKPNYSDWMARDRWDNVEAACLMNGLDPKHVRQYKGICVFQKGFETAETAYGIIRTWDKKDSASNFFRNWSPIKYINKYLLVGGKVPKKLLQLATTLLLRNCSAGELTDIAEFAESFKSLINNNTSISNQKNITKTPPIKTSNLFVAQQDKIHLKVTTPTTHYATELSISEAKQQRLHALHEIIKEEYCKLSDNNTKTVKPHAIWTNLKHMANQNHETIQEVDKWTDQNSKINYLSHRNCERTMGRRCFENFVSRLNNPK